MMKNISLILIFTLLSCSGQDSKPSMGNDKETKSLKNAPYNITDEGDGTKSNYDDLSPDFIRTAKKILEQRKFQFPDEKTFNQKVSEVFSFNLKNYTNSIIALRPAMFPEVAIRKDKFIFIQDANANEPKFINPDLLYHFNSYVFYNTSASYAWLQANSPDLLYDLAVHYGYQKEKNILFIIQDPDGFTNLRKGKSSSSQILQKIETGEKVNVLGQNGDWWLVVSKEGKKGYIHKSRIKTE